MKILVVDDDPVGRNLLRAIFETYQCDVIDAENGEKGLEMAALHVPDLIVSDAMMPVMDGFQFLRNLKGDEKLRSIPFVFYTGVYGGRDEYDLAMSHGAAAYIVKPQTPEALWKEISGILDGPPGKGNRYIVPESTGGVDDYLEKYSRIVSTKLEEKVRELENEITERKKIEEDLRKSEFSYRALSERLSGSLEKVQEREQDLQRSRDAFLNMLEDISDSYKDLRELFTSLVRVMVNALDAKSPWTKGHSVRVAMYAEEVAREMALDEDEIKKIHLAGMLHDIGKIGTYDQVLDKPSRLTDEEFELVKKHPGQGADILKEIKQLRDVIPLIRHHHERIDGRGYPDGLKGGEIPLGARILHVADSFDSMTADRPYRLAPGLEYAVSELHRCNGSQFDSEAVKAFLTILAARE